MKETKIKNPIRAVIGKAPWRVWKGCGSFLFFYFGRKRRLSPRLVTGYHVIVVSMAHWVIRHAGKKIAHSESSDKQIEESAKQFEGRPLVEIVTRKHVRARKTCYSARFVFENRWCLNIYMYERETFEEMFSVRNPFYVTRYTYTGELKTRRISRSRARRAIAARRSNVRISPRTKGRLVGRSL